MKAVIFDEFGPPSMLQLKTDVPVPVRKPGEVLVKIISTSVNPIDYKTRKGEVPRAFVKRPKVLGGDVAGIVVETDDPCPFHSGDRVFACTDGFQFTSREGSYCEFASVPVKHLALLPFNVDIEDAGGLPLVCLTAWQALDAANVSQNMKVLIHAGAGGVGSAAIQLAKARGLHVTTTCSTRNVDFCKELGADEVIDYTTQRFEEVCRSSGAERAKEGLFDAVIDLIGGEVEVRSMQVLKSNKNSTYVNVLNSGWVKEKGMAAAPLFLLWHLVKGKIKGALRLGPAYKFIIAHPSGEQLGKVAALLENGQLRPVVWKKLPLEAAVEGHELLEQGHARGKIVLVVAPQQS